MGELLDCPCCGYAAKYFQSSSRSSGHGESSDLVGVECSKCHLKIEFGSYANYQVFERKECAAKIWNTRKNSGIEKL